MDFPFQKEKTYDKITTHFAKKNSLFSKTKPLEYSCVFASVSFSKEELETAQSYTASLGRGKLDYYWDDSTQWKRELYNNKCDTCLLPKGEQIKPWVLKRDFKQLEKHPFVGFEGLPGYIFCSKELAKRIKKEFGIGHMEVLIGKKKRVSENLVQLKIPLAPYKLLLDGTPYGYTNNDEGEIIKDKIPCSECKEATYINQTLDFLSAF